MITEKSAGFILISDNVHTSDPSVLLLHYLSGHWDFPKGNIEIDETEMQAATRELKEETGIEIFTILPGFRHVLNYKYTKKSTLISKQVTLFLASTDVNKVEISHEHIGYQWMEINAAVNQLTYSNAKTALASAINFLKDLTQNTK
ncbi:MAG TPA: NUDIX domain-containing protein [Nitrososphaeraceae archaeon]|nr:NUDIX domain-containing protein [Nitrososphaeraceae archaeon]